MPLSFDISCNQISLVSSSSLASETSELSAPIVAHVDVVAEVGHLDHTGGARVPIRHASLSDEVSAVHAGTMLEQDWALCTKLCLRCFILNMEHGQLIVVNRGDSQWLPIVGRVGLSHQSSET